MELYESGTLPSLFPEGEFSLNEALKFPAVTQQLPSGEVILAVILMVCPTVNFGTAAAFVVTLKIGKYTSTPSPTESVLAPQPD